jgi:hypothetical protein
VEQGQLDYAFVNPSDYLQRSDRLRAKYGVNKERFWTAPGLSLRFFVLNTSPIRSHWVALRGRPEGAPRA